MWDLKKITKVPVFSSGSCSPSCHTHKNTHWHSRSRALTCLTCRWSLQAAGLRVQHLPKSNVRVWPWVTHSIELEKWCTHAHSHTFAHAHTHTQSLTGTRVSIKLKKRVECLLPLQGLLCDKIDSGCSHMRDSWAHQTTVNHITEAGRAQLH